MGGFTGYRRPIRTTGDLTGGGGRSVEPVRRGAYPMTRAIGRYYGPQEREVPAGGWAPPPPGGGYSGGVIPRFQGGSKIRGKGAAARARGRGRAPARRQQPWTWVPEEGLWGLPNTGDPGYFYTLKQPGQGGAPAYTPGGGGGGYSGGVIPRFQSGRTVNPRSVAAAARRRNAPPPPQERRYPPRFNEWEMEKMLEEYRSSLPVPPGGWQAGRTVNPRSVAAAARRRNAPPPPRAQERIRFEGPNWPFFRGNGDIPPPPGGWPVPPPPGGWQEGGQFPEAAFPVESELADESPWYPDEEVGFEEAAPMQGGFDIFGRSGG